MPWAWLIPQYGVVFDRAVGWPALCLNCAESWSDVTTPHKSSGRIDFGNWTFPVRPIPCGFILDTLFYAPPIALLWFLTCRARTYLRRRRGLCTHCKYNLSSLSPDPATNLLRCPECGREQASPVQPAS
jgi:hypothetical protein